MLRVGLSGVELRLQRKLTNLDSRFNARGVGREWLQEDLAPGTHEAFGFSPIQSCVNQIVPNVARQQIVPKGISHWLQGFQLLKRTVSSTRTTNKEAECSKAL